MKNKENQIQDILSVKIDSEIVKNLITTYDAVQKEYGDGDYESTLSKSGKFVENVFRALNYIITNQSLTEIKGGELEKLIDKLEKSNGKKFSEIIRVVIPRVARATYTMRSKMGSEHVKLTTPDFIDAKFIVSSCDWMISELLRSIHGRDSAKINTMIQNQKPKKKFKLDSFKIQLAGQINTTSIYKLVLIILGTDSPQTRKQIHGTLKEIGRDIGNWLSSGKFNDQIIKKGYAIKVPKNDSNVQSFSLTTKGMILAEKLIDEVKMANHS